MTLVLGLIVALGLPVFIDGALRRRKVRHAASKAGLQGRTRSQGRTRLLADTWGRIDSQ